MKKREIILEGSFRYKGKKIIPLIITNICFNIIPIIAMILGIITFIIYIFSLSSEYSIIFAEIFGFFEDLFELDVSWIFSDGRNITNIVFDYPLVLSTRLIISALVLFVGKYLIRAQCPFCGHFFTLRRISEDNYQGSSESRVSNTYYDVNDGFITDMSGNIYYTQMTTRNKEYGTEKTDYYTYNTKCTHCGCVVRKHKSETATHWD